MLQSLIKRFKNNYLSRAVIFTMDIILSILASVLVLFIVDSILGHFHISPVAGVRAKLSYLVLAAAASAVSFAIFRPYRIIIRRLSSKDHLVFAAAAGLKGILVLAVVIPFTSFFGTNILLAGIDAMVTFALLVSVRLMMIIVWEHFNSRIQEKYEYKRVVVYGTSDKSVASIVRLQNSPHYKVIGFLDPDADGRTIEGLPVFSPKDDDEMEKTLIQSRADALLFPTDREAQGEENRLIRFATQKGIQCLIIPTVDEVVEGEARVERLPTVGDVKDRDVGIGIRIHAVAVVIVVSDLGGIVFVFVKFVFKPKKPAVKTNIVKEEHEIETPAINRNIKALPPPSPNINYNQSQSYDPTGTSVLTSSSEASYIERMLTGEIVKIETFPFTIGKDRDSATYCIYDNDTISRIHCIIVCMNGEFNVMDNNSTNGTYVDGYKITPLIAFPLRNGSAIMISNETLIFHTR